MATKEKFLAILAIVLFFIITLGFLLKDLTPGGQLVVETDFLKFTPYFTILKPQARVVMGEDNYLKAEPIYFDLYLPRDFATVKLEIEYKNEFNYNLAVGPNIGEGWDLQKIINPGSSEFQQANLTFDLAGKNINHGKLRFMISAPGLQDENKGVSLRKIKVTMARTPLWQDNPVDNLIKYLAYVKNQY